MKIQWLHPGAGWGGKKNVKKKKNKKVVAVTIKIPGGMESGFEIWRGGWGGANRAGWKKSVKKKKSHNCAAGGVGGLSRRGVRTGLKGGGGGE